MAVSLRLLSVTKSVKESVFGSGMIQTTRGLVDDAAILVTTGEYCRRTVVVGLGSDRTTRRVLCCLSPIELLIPAQTCRAVYLLDVRGRPLRAWLLDLVGGVTTYRLSHTSSTWRW